MLQEQDSRADGASVASNHWSYAEVAALLQVLSKVPQEPWDSVPAMILQAVNGR